MKKGFVFVLTLLVGTALFANDLPEILKGEWIGKDRIITFSDDQKDEDLQLVLSLRTYYGLYNDRVAEPAEYAEINPRTRNIATHKDAEHIPFEIEPLVVNDMTVPNGWSLKLKYSKHDIKYVPFVIIDDEIYFNFFVQVNNHCFAQIGSSDGIKISKIDDKENIACLIFVRDSDSEKTDVFDVRYWKSKMDYSDESAFFSWNGNEYYVPKHILSGVQNYSCTSGRSNKIRNPMPPIAHNYEDFIFAYNNQVAVKKGTETLKKN